MPSESEVNLAKSLTAINAELRVGFSTLNRELTKERNAACRNWRPRLHQRQNSRKRATRNSLKLTIKSLSTLRPLLTSGIHTITSRESLVGADSVENCWEMVSECECKDVADDSDDDKRSRRAEAEGSQKRCRSQSQENSQSFLRNRPTPDLTLYTILFI